MNNRIIEFIRQLLIAIVFPIKKRKDTLAKKVRLSITLRIAYAYAKMFIIFGVLILFIFCLEFFLFCESKYKDKMDEVVTNVESHTKISKDDDLYMELKDYVIQKDTIKDKIVFKDKDSSVEESLKYLYHRSINPFIDDNLNMKIVSNKNREELYNDLEEDVTLKNAFFKAAYLTKVKGKIKFIVIEKRPINISNQECTIYFQIDFSDDLNNFKDLIGYTLLIIVLLAILMGKGGIKRIIPIFYPIKQMAASANKLTVNNLNSERLNIEGTKNELRDLATTINNMLDRLDISYESQKQFVSDASHELRTPIAVIQGYVNMLDRWGKTDEEILEESIEAIKNEAKAMQDLVEKLLFLSRHDKKTLKLDKKRFNILPVVEEMIKETNLVAKDRIVDSRYLENAGVYADKQSIKQAIRIFIDNAVKYSEAGDHIYISCKSDRDGSCIIEVEDTGMGMQQKDVEKVFERFYRVDSSRSKQISGNGLGLSLAKLIILKHTGTITVRTQFQKGTTIRIKLPPANIM